MYHLLTILGLLCLVNIVSSERFNCSFDICDTNDDQYCDIPDDRCHYCSDRQCADNVERCQDYCQRKATTPETTQPPTFSFSAARKEIGLTDLSPSFRVLLYSIALGIAILIVLCFIIIWRLKNNKKTNQPVASPQTADIEMQAVIHSQDSGVDGSTNESLQSVPLLSAGPSTVGPVIAVLDNDYNPGTGRMLAGDSSIAQGDLNSKDRHTIASPEDNSKRYERTDPNELSVHSPMYANGCRQDLGSGLHETNVKSC